MTALLPTLTTPNPTTIRRANDLAVIGLEMLRMACDTDLTPDDQVETFLTHARFCFQAVTDMHTGVPVCPGCNGRGQQLEIQSVVCTCDRCHGIFTPDGQAITQAEAMTYVHINSAMVPGGSGQYFDLTLRLPSGQLHRLHGWMDQRTRRVQQWG